MVPGARRAPAGVGLVMAGAVARGAFGIGAVSGLVERQWPIRRIAAASSGALTAAIVAAGAATGQLAYATEVATDLWLNHAAWSNVTHVSLGDWLHARGLLDTTAIVAIVQDAIRGIVERAPRGAEQVGFKKLTLVTTSLSPLPHTVGILPTYEKAASFARDDFFDPAQWPRIATFAAASATFPGVFAPTLVTGIDGVDGDPCVDGGVVNNTPISYVLDDPAVDSVVVISSEASQPAATARVGGLDLVGRIADIAINERIGHDMRVAMKTNARLREVVRALEATGATSETRDRVLGALGWRDVDLVLIHPDPPLSGTSFSGFFDRDLRMAYIRAGQRAAESSLA
jgi:predicted acylesterase/phospholipase RssA